MAIKHKYPVQFAFVGTEDQRKRLEAEAERTDVSLAHVVRLAVDARYGLVDGKDPNREERPEE